MQVEDMFIKEDGNIINKKEFEEKLDSLRKIYQEILDEEQNLSHNLFEMCVNTETQNNMDFILDSFNFYDNSIYITDELNSEVVQKVFNTIRFCNKVNEQLEKGYRPINIFINSYGGDLDAALSICAAIQTSKVPVYTYNIGKAYSGALLVLISGTKRFGLPYSSYLFHEGNSAYQDNAHKFVEWTEFYKSQLDIIKNLVLKNTKISLADYNTIKKDDFWFNNEIALKNGVIDSVIDYIGADYLQLKEDKVNENIGQN